MFLRVPIIGTGTGRGAARDPYRADAPPDATVISSIIPTDAGGVPRESTCLSWVPDSVGSVPTNRQLARQDVVAEMREKYIRYSLAALEQQHQTTRVTVFGDMFSQADENPLSSGGVWAGGYTGDADLAVVGTRVRGTTATTADNSARHNGTLANDQWGQITLATFTPTVRFGSVLLRFAAPATYSGYQCTGAFNTSGSPNNRVYISLFTAGAETELAAELVTTPVSGDRLLATVVGTGLTLYLNDVSRVTATDGTYSAGFAGLHIYTNTVSGVELDEFFSGQFTDQLGEMWLH